MKSHESKSLRSVFFVFDILLLFFQTNFTKNRNIIKQIPQTIDYKIKPSKRLHNDNSEHKLGTITGQNAQPRPQTHFVIIKERPHKHRQEKSLHTQNGKTIIIDPTQDSEQRPKRHF
jgi:hypothetical protein